MGSTVRLVPADSLHRARPPSQGAMAQAWDEAVELGLLALPLEPDTRTEDGTWISTGSRTIVEVREGPRYRATTNHGLDDLDVGRRMRKILGAVRRGTDSTL